MSADQHPSIFSCQSQAVVSISTVGTNLHVVRALVIPSRILEHELHVKKLLSKKSVCGWREHRLMDATKVWLALQS